uniref:Zinc finger and BTB domain containing 18 n=1 Tax=Homo sapiens TaxID=9606 RepID=A0A8Q3WLD9_HUMAN
MCPKAPSDLVHVCYTCKSEGINICFYTQGFCCNTLTLKVMKTVWSFQTIVDICYSV